MVKYPPEEPILFYSNQNPQRLHLGSEGFGMTLQDCISLAFLPTQLLSLKCVRSMISALSLLSSFLFMTPLHCPPLICTIFHYSSFLYHAFSTDSYFLSVAIIVLLLINVPSFPCSLSFCLFSLVLLYCFSMFYTKGFHTSLHHPCYLLLLTSFLFHVGSLCVF